MIASCVCVCNYACGGSSLVTTDHAALVGATQPCLMRLLLLVITGDSVTRRGWPPVPCQWTINDGLLIFKKKSCTPKKPRAYFSESMATEQWQGRRWS